MEPFGTGECEVRDGAGMAVCIAWELCFSEALDGELLIDDRWLGCLGV